MKFLIHSDIYRVNPLALEQPYRNLFRRIQHHFANRAKIFWQFSRYYGCFITHSRKKY